jgi:transcriptional regulator with XRE-family HTH domain
MGDFLRIGASLVEERKRLGLSQTEFAAIPGVTRKTLFGYETGERVPDAAALAAWAAIGVDIAYVITGLRAKAHRKLAAIGQASELLQKAGAPEEVARQLMPALVELLSEESGGLSPDESVLLEAYRRCAPADQTVVRQMASRFGDDAAAKLPVKKKRKTE